MSALRNPRNKYGARRTWNETLQRTFHSGAESRRATELYLAQQCGEIQNLEFQVPLILSQKPQASVKAVIDFRYTDHDRVVYEDVKGKMTAEARVKYAWVQAKYGIAILLSH